MPKLVCKRVVFYSQNDETAFFEWLNRISCIQEIKGVGDELHLQIPRKQISDANLRDLIAVFERYEVDMKQLAQFLNDKNKAWFKGNAKAFWLKKVFG